MNDLFVELLSICIDRLADGDAVADCLADFPECPELGPLLETAAVLLAAEARPLRSDAWATVAAARLDAGGRGDASSDGDQAFPRSA
jgi:hypothetical protein